MPTLTSLSDFEGISYKLSLLSALLTGEMQELEKKTIWLE